MPEQNSLNSLKEIFKIVANVSSRILAVNSWKKLQYTNICNMLLVRLETSTFSMATRCYITDRVSTVGEKHSFMN